jgi:hypothetical protein
LQALSACKRHQAIAQGRKPAFTDVS